MASPDTIVDETIDTIVDETIEWTVKVVFPVA
jgi:hypothetical protein